MEVQEKMEKATKSMEDLIAQLPHEPSFKHPLCRPLGLDKALRSIWGLLKVETMKGFSNSNA